MKPAQLIIKTLICCLILIVSLVLLTGCGGKKENRTDELKYDSIQLDELFGPIETVPNDQPVWAEGTTFSKQAMVNTIRHRTAKIQQIYRRIEMDIPGLKGQVTLHFNIYPDGTVGDVEVRESSWNHPGGSAVTDSLVTYAERWTFPPGVKKPVRVTQPWKFDMQRE